MTNTKIPLDGLLFHTHAEASTGLNNNYLTNNRNLQPALSFGNTQEFWLSLQETKPQRTGICRQVATFFIWDYNSNSQQTISIILPFGVSKSHSIKLDW